MNEREGRLNIFTFLDYFYDEFGYIPDETTTIENHMQYEEGFVSETWQRWQKIYRDFYIKEL